MNAASIFREYIRCLIYVSSNANDEDSVNDEADRLWKAMDEKSRQVARAVSEEINRLEMK